MSIKDPTGKLARWSIYLSQFDFEIIHKKGKTHSNADYLSRPNEHAFIIKHDPSCKDLDPYEDAALVYYLRHKKHRDGSSRKQVNRVIKRARNLDMVEETIKIEKEGKWLTIPTPEKRHEIIDKAHASAAHFGIISTLNKIKEDYWWPKLARDVEEFVKNCDTCIRNSEFKVANHPAFANELTSINDEISIDFSWGYPETNDGYKGIMHIQEDVSKRLKSYLMKSKSEEEISRRLIDYFCTFGPCKRIRSDNEPGLIGKTIERIKNSMGVEWHKTVASFSPSHNGMIERFVQTFGLAIRKLSEKDKTKWHEWIPFIDLAYNTRIHSITRKPHTN
jgi:hypothetical protein